MVSSAKLYSLGILFVISVISGLVIPYILLKILSRKCQSSSGFRRIIGLLNCFSGGVFIATSLLTLLPEARETFEEALSILNPASHYPFTELLLGIGFLVILLIESTTQTFYQTRCKNEEDITSNKVHDNLQTLQYQKKEKATGEKHSCNEYCASYQNGHVRVFGMCRTAVAGPTSNGKSESENTTAETNVNANCLNETIFAQGMSNLHSFVLILALSIHMLFDGLSIGLQDNDSKVWSILLAMSFHKVLIFLSTGITICESTTTVKFVIALLFMSVVSPIGVAVGIAVTSQQTNAALLTASAVLQGFSVGTFVYVAFFEILLREFAVNVGDKIVKALLAVIGFALLAVVKYAMPEMEMPEPEKDMSNLYHL